MENENISYEDELLSFISDQLRIELDIKEIGQLKWEMSRYTPFSKTMNDKYDKLTLKNFLILYKINRLKSLNIISEAVTQELKDLFYLKLELGERIGTIALFDEEEKNNELKKLLQEYNKIEIIFRRYHLFETRLDLKKIIDMMIVNENYNILNQNIEIDDAKLINQEKSK